MIKPGNNVVAETLIGAARLILVPDASFMEGLDEHAAWVADTNDGSVGAPNRQSLEPLIRDALRQPPRAPSQVFGRDALNAVVNHVHESAIDATQVNIAPKELLLVLVAPQSVALREAVTGVLTAATVLNDSDRPWPVLRLDSLPLSTGPSALFAPDSDATNRTPQDLVDRGVRLLLHPSAEIRRWLRLKPARPELLTAPAERLIAQRGGVLLARQRIARVLETSAYAALVLDLTRLHPDEIVPYLDAIGRWFVTQPIRLVDAGAFAARRADQLLGR